MVDEPKYNLRYVLLTNTNLNELHHQLGG